MCHVLGQEGIQRARLRQASSTYTYIYGYNIVIYGCFYSSVAGKLTLTIYCLITSEL